MSAPQTFPNAPASRPTTRYLHNPAMIGPRLARDNERGRAAPYHGWPL